MKTVVGCSWKLEINVPRGLQFEGIIKFENAWQFFKTMETLMNVTRDRGCRFRFSVPVPYESLETLTKPPPPPSPVRFSRTPFVGGVYIFSRITQDDKVYDFKNDDKHKTACKIRNVFATLLAMID